MLKNIYGRCTKKRVFRSLTTPGLASIIPFEVRKTLFPDLRKPPKLTAGNPLFSCAGLKKKGFSNSMNRQRLMNLWTLLCGKRLLTTLSAALVLISLSSTASLNAMAEEEHDRPAIAEAVSTTTSAVSGRSTTTGSATSATTETYEVLVSADGETREVNLLGGTVLQAIALTGVTVGQDDLVSVAGDTPITQDLAVTVSRVTFYTYTKTESIAFKTVTKNDRTMMVGTSKVSQTGKNGEQNTTYRETYVDGQLTATETVGTEIVNQAVDKIVLKGTRRPAAETITVGGGITLQLDANGQPLDYKELLTGKATAYTAPGNNTSIGLKAQVGVVAVDPKIIPYGTKLYIVSPDGKWVYGYAVAGDTGGALLSGRVLVDVYYDTVEECYKFGRRTMNVYIIG